MTTDAAEIDFTSAPEIDFASAEDFLRQARQAHEAGDQAMFIAARQMVLVALGLPMVSAPFRSINQDKPKLHLK